MSKPASSGGKAGCTVQVAAFDGRKFGILASALQRISISLYLFLIYSVHWGWALPIGAAPRTFVPDCKNLRAATKSCLYAGSQYATWYMLLVWVVWCMAVRPGLWKLSMNWRWIALKWVMRWMCGVKLNDRKKSEELRELIGLEPVSLMTKKSRLRWFGHVERIDYNDWVKRCIRERLNELDRGQVSWTMNTYSSSSWFQPLVPPLSYSTVVCLQQCRSVSSGFELDRNAPERRSGSFFKTPFRFIFLKIPNENQIAVVAYTQVCFRPWLFWN